MSCQVCHRMICRCGPDLTEAFRAQNELHEQIYLMQKERGENTAKITGLNSMLEKAVQAFDLIACGSLCNPREVAIRTLDEIKRMRAGTQGANKIPAQIAGIAEKASPKYEGWQLVPKEPTEQMKYAFHHGATGFFRDSYSAMLDAAPKPEAAK